MPFATKWRAARRGAIPEMPLLPAADARNAPRRRLGRVIPVSSGPKLTVPRGVSSGSPRGSTRIGSPGWASGPTGSWSQRPPADGTALPDGGGCRPRSHRPPGLRVKPVRSAAGLHRLRHGPIMLKWREKTFRRQTASAAARGGAGAVFAVLPPNRAPRPRSPSPRPCPAAAAGRDRLSPAPAAPAGARSRPPYSKCRAPNSHEYTPERQKYAGELGAVQLKKRFGSAILAPTPRVGSLPGSSLADSQSRSDPNAPSGV